MKFRLQLAALSMVLVLTRPAWSQICVPEVRVTGNISDVDARRDFVAGKIIIGRKRIEESGVRKVEELLKREPAVTVGSDGRIGLLNMPGYTQVLIDGKEPVGRSATDLDLTLVEKIEIIKSSMAEYGPFGIAGTINIISRKTARKTETDFSAGIANTRGKAEGDFSLSHNWSTVGAPLRYSFAIAGNSSGYLSRSVGRQTVKVSGLVEREQWHGAVRSQWRRPAISGSAEILWTRANGETFRFAPQVAGSKSSGTQDEIRFGESGVFKAYADSGSATRTASLPLSWQFKPSAKSQVEISAGVVFVRMEESRDWLDDGYGVKHTARADIIRHDADSHSLDVVYKASLMGGHDLKLGSSMRRIEFDKSFDHRSEGEIIRALGALGTGRNSVDRYLRVFAQDEWRVDDKTALSAGISAQRTAITVGEDLYLGRTRFQLWSPSVHLSRKLGADDTRQLRVEMARSFKAPEADAYTTHPQINSLAPCPIDALCGPNTIGTADEAGNLALRPERSLALNLSYEHGLGDDSQFTFELFSRQIDNKIGKEIRMDRVPWAAVPRYIALPVNLGKASSSGVNIELVLAARDIFSHAPNLAIRGSAVLAASRVFSIPAPHNRLDKQTPWSAKLGGTYKKKGVPLVLDIDASWKPSGWTRTGLSERIYIARHRAVDANLKWNMAQSRRLILSWKSVAPGTADSINEFLNADELVRVYRGTRRFSTVRLQFETPL